MITKIGSNFLERNSDIFKSKEEIKTIGEISSLELFLCNNPDCSNILSDLRNIWKYRSKFSHTCKENEYDKNYYEKQDSTLVILYRIICKIISYEDPNREICKKSEQLYKSLEPQYGLFMKVHPGSFNKPQNTKGRN